MGGHYRKHGLSILYPENWQVADSGEWEFPFELSFESPDGAMISMTFCDRELDQESVLKTYLDSLQEQYEDIELVPAESTLAEREGSGINALFYCLDFLVTAQVRIYAAKEFWVAIMYQAENRTFDRHQLVFDAIATSLLREKKYF